VNAVYNTNGVLQAPLYQFPQTAPASGTNDPHFRDPQAAQWNRTVERELTPNTVLRASYVGMQAVRQFVRYFGLPRLIAGVPHVLRGHQQEPVLIGSSRIDAGRFGNCGAGILQGPNLIGANLGLAKNFSIRKRYRLRFEATFTNTVNRLNFAPPQTNVNNPQFGALTSVLPQGAGGNRTGQLAPRLDS